jgi:SP family arabinose:H+ symporter-like MFS transporter
LVGAIAGVAGAGVLSDRFGRKKILLLAAVLFFISSIGSAVSSTITVFIIARFIGGMGIGIASMLSPLFISEFTPPDIRGRMVSLYQLAITIGIVGAYFSNVLLVHWSHNFHASESSLLHWVVAAQVWRGMFGVGTLPALLFFLLLWWIPESPRWLMSKEKNNRALKILKDTSGSKKANKQAIEIKRSLNKESGSIRQLLKPGLRIALLIGILLPFFQQASGINVIIYYGPKIFNAAGFTFSSALGGQVTIGIVNVIATFIAIWKVDDFGRRPLLLGGITGVILSLICVGVIFAFGINQGIWLLIFFLLFIISFASTLGPITFVVISEIFPTNIRGRAMAVAIFSLWISDILVAQTFPWLQSNLGASYTFLLYAIICLPAFWLVWKIIPETKGKSLEEIEHYWLKLEK